jgi:ubiquinone/menaquinone biosynthesis C-methylase UbiE
VFPKGVGSLGAERNRVCPVHLAGSLDNRLRRWVQNPERILKPHVREGMTALDVGCGPGFFSIDLARLVGPSGRVIACDLQPGMLQKLKAKIEGTDLANRITLHRCEEDRIGVSEKVDFVLAFYVVHELTDPRAFFEEVASLLKPGGQVFIVEPPLHVSRAGFEETLRQAAGVGLTLTTRPRLPFNKAAILRKV